MAIESNINYLNIFPFSESPSRLEAEAILPNGGKVRAGAYTFFLRYLDGYGSPTNFFTASPQIAVPLRNPGGHYTGSEGEQQTAQVIVLRAHNIDLKYSHVQLAVIPQYNGSSGTPFIMPAVAIMDEEMRLVYTGTEAVVDSTLEEILIDRASYKRAKAITQIDNALYLGNLHKHDVLEYQRYANNIRVKAVTETFPDAWTTYDGFVEMRSHLPSRYASPINLVYRSKGFKRGDVYAFYISFVLDDGTESPAYHIPGRAATTFTYSGEVYDERAGLPITEERLRDIAGGDRGKWFQFISAPHPTLGTGYWENENERYPNNTDWEVWDVNSSGDGVYTGSTLVGAKVRHHQMPDVEYSPLFESTGEVDVLGVQFENIKIPNNLVSRIKGIKIHYAKRELNNQRVVDQSFLLGTAAEDPDSVMTSQIINQSRPFIPFYLLPYTQEPEENNSPQTRDVILVHPFNSLRLKQSITGITHIKQVGITPIVPTAVGIPGFGPNNLVGLNHYRVTRENLVENLDFTSIPERRFRKIEGASYLPSYTFTEEDGANGIISLGSANFPRDFDNTNGEEKIAFRLDAPIPGVAGHFPTGSGAPPTPDPVDMLYEFCQYMEDVYIGFDKQEILHTGFVDMDIDKYVPSLGGSGFSTGPVFGGDTFLGVFESRHTRWLDDGDPVKLNVRTSLVETYAFPYYRSPGQHPWESWRLSGGLRNFLAIIWKDGQPNFEDKEGDVFPDHVIRYNQDYLMNETYKPAFPKPKRQVHVQKLPTRVIRSRQVRSDQSVDSFREFLADDFIDLPTHRGQLIRLTNLSGILIPHMESSLFRTRAREELQTGDFRAFLGTGDIFSVTPEELYETDIGRGGLHAHRAGLVSEYGYFFADYKARKVFHITPQGALEVSSNGLENFFKENLGFALEGMGFTRMDVVSPYFGIEVTWDPVNKRYLLTKKDLKLAVDDVEVPYYSEVASAVPVPEFEMFAVGGRTQEIGIIASWWTTQGAQSQIDWAITEGYTPPLLSEYQTTPWTEDFVKDHEIPFPEVRMNQYHWFFARSRNADGQVLSSPRRGIYVVPSEFISEQHISTKYNVEKLVIPLFQWQNVGRLSVNTSVNNESVVIGVVTEKSLQQVALAGESEIINSSNIYTNIIIQ